MYDVTGRLMLLPHQEADRLSPLQKELIADCVRGDVIKTSNRRTRGDIGEALKDLHLRGLTRRTDRGLVLTGRGFALRDALYEMRMKDDPRYAWNRRP